MEEAFKKVVEHIFTNWTALNLAILNSDQPQSKSVIPEFVNYVVQFCLSNQNTCVGDIEEVLSDIMDQEFDAICEDGSTEEIAKIMDNFVQLLKQGDVQKFEEEYSKLPISAVSKTFTTQSSQSGNRHQIVDSDSDTSDDAPQQSGTPMEEDSEWVTVKSKRKR